MLDLGDILRHGSPSTPDGEPPGDDIEAAYRAGYAEAVAYLRDDARYRNWWTSSDYRAGRPSPRLAPDGPIRYGLANYLETVGPSGMAGEPDPYADVRPPDGECYCGGCIGTGRCDDDLGRADDGDWDDLDDEDDGVIWIPSIEIVDLPEQDVT